MMKPSLLVLHAMTMILCLVSYPSELHCTERPFTVADSIMMTRLSDPDPSHELLRASDFHVSPNQEFFAVVTRKGSLSTGKNTYSLLLYRVDVVRKFVGSDLGKELPSPVLLAQVETSSSEDAISHLSWLRNSKELAFISVDPQGLRQIFAVDVVSHKQRQLTYHPQDIGSYEISVDCRTIIYSAREIPDWTDRNARGYAVKSEYISYLSTTDPVNAVPEWRYFVASLSNPRSFRPIQLETSIVPDNAWLSPSGEWAIALEHIRGIPKRWLDYNLLADSMSSNAHAAASEAEAPTVPSRSSFDSDNDAFGAPSGWLVRFVLINTKTGAARPLLDTPSDGAGSQIARWSTDGKRVVVGPVFMPLSVEDNMERERRRRVQAIAEVEIATGNVKRIADFPASRLHNQWPVFLGQLEFMDREVVVVTELVYPRGPSAPQAYRKRGDNWIPDPEYVLPAPLLNLSVVQDMNTPPELAASYSELKGQRAFTDLNPQLRRVALGNVEAFEWSDRMQRRFTGGLVFPPNFQSGKRYAVVIQTYGFRESSFLADGPEWMTTAYAARALAGRQMLVLQMPEGPSSSDSNISASLGSWQDNGENPRFVSMLEGAIDALDARGLIDRNRVGLIGFSRAGMHVHYAVTFSAYPIAAATIADSVVATPFSYALMYGAYFPGMLEYEDESFMGAPFWGEGVKRWIERSPAFHLNKIRTPLRFEHIGTFPPPFWDTFAILKRHESPVEMIHIPLGTHVLQTPFARYTSQQGNVDWFSFWLLNQEDDDPEKAQQYGRWQKLRAQHVKNLQRIESESLKFKPQ